jgi:radical SAM protein with 4Fe4S-binding SPASM domain
VTIAVGLNSIDDTNAETRDAAPDRALQVLELCRELKIKRHVIITIGKHNVDSFERTVDYLVKHHISYNRSPLVARGSGCNHFRQQAFSREDMERSFHPVMRNRINGYISYTPYFLSPEVHDQVSGGLRNGTVPRNPPVGCWVGAQLAVNAEGDVSVCPVMLDVLSAGNVREQPLDHLVNESPLFAQLTDRTQLKGRCGRCRYQGTCGGCRAMAYFHTGDYMEEDPTCFFEPVDRTTVSEHEAVTNRFFTRGLVVGRHNGGYRPPCSSSDTSEAPSGDCGAPEAAPRSLGE